jgi:hypothetical protein
MMEKHLTQVRCKTYYVFFVTQRPILAKPITQNNPELCLSGLRVLLWEE